MQSATERCTAALCAPYDAMFTFHSAANLHCYDRLLSLLVVLHWLLVLKDGFNVVWRCF
jgi:hypothetical protein